MMRRIVLEPGQRLTEADLARSGGVDAEILGVAARIVDDVARAATWRCASTPRSSTRSSSTTSA